MGLTSHHCLACCSYSWNIIAGHQERTSEVFRKQLAKEGIDAAVFESERNLPLFKGGLLDYHINILNPTYKGVDLIDENTVKWINTNFDTFNRLAFESEKFRFALEAAIDWRYSNNCRMAVARLWTGIEAIFGMKSELVYRISVLASSLLVERGDARLEKFRSIKRLYNIRSKAVHGDKISDEILINATIESYKLLRDLLFYIVKKGKCLTEDEMDSVIFF